MCKTYDLEPANRWAKSYARAFRDNDMATQLALANEFSTSPPNELPASPFLLPSLVQHLAQPCPTPRASIPNGFHKILDTLILNGFDIDELSPHGNALHLATESRMIGICDSLLELGANPNHFDAQGICPLFIAARTDQVELCKLLIRFGADPTTMDHFGHPPHLQALRFSKTKASVHLLAAYEFCILSLDSGDTSPARPALRI